MAVEVLERVFLQAVQGQVAVVLVPLQDAPPFQEAGHPLADALQQLVKLLDGRGACVAEAVVTRLILYVHPIQKQHVEMDVQVERRPEALDQGDRAGGGFLLSRPVWMNHQRLQCQWLRLAPLRSRKALWKPLHYQRL